jgi:hypothetical protein
MVPRWSRAADELLGWAVARVQLIWSCTPMNLDEELVALAAAFARGAERQPRFVYPDAPADDARAPLERAAEVLDEQGPLGAIYAARARELALEAHMAQCVGTALFHTLAARRYPATDDAADALAARWLDARRVSPEAELCATDDDDPRSLLSRMRAAVGERRLAVRVVPSTMLSSLAATGPGVIYVARGRRLGERAVARTVLHEIEGHALPRARSAHAALGIFARGTARGSDDQEGRALALEDEAGLLDGERRLELARRHHAGKLLRAGSDFVETTRALERDAGASRESALRIVSRVNRGGGLGRELAYLPAYLRVRAARAADPTVDAVLAAGQVSLDAADVLRPWMQEAAE